MMPKDSQRSNKLKSIHQFVVFAGIVPRTGEFVVLTLQGALATRSNHRFSEDNWWDTEFTSAIKGAPWDFEANAAEMMSTMESFQGDWTLARSDPVIEFPRRVNVRRMYILRVEIEKRPDERMSQMPEGDEVNRGLIRRCQTQ